MIKILFICHGNICRSPMAEFLFRDYVEKHGAGDQFTIASAATSTEEIGNPPHPGARRKLWEAGISMDGKYSVQLRWSDYDQYDYIIGMDQRNIKNMMRMLKNDPRGKVYKFLAFTDDPRDIADPWYTGNFEETYRDICQGCQGFFQYLCEQGKISDR